MHHTYRRLFRQAGAWPLLAAGLPGRLPIASYGLGLLALATARYGSFGVGGAVASAYTLATIVTGPLTGRWCGHARYRRALAVLVVGHALAMLGLVGAANARVSPWLVGTCAVVVGLLLPPAGVISRARWSGMLATGGRPREPDLMGTALFLESALDETAFIIGPPLITATGALLGPDVALLAATVLATMGCLGLALPRPPPQRSSHVEPARRRLGSVALLRLCLAFVAVGWVFASVQVGVFAVTAANGVAWQAGLVLLVFAAASLAAGLLGGLLPAARTADGRHRASLAVLAFGLIPALRSGGSVQLALFLLPAALAASPAVAMGFARAGAIWAGRAGEAIAWCAAAMGVGLALGSLVGGVLADAAGGRGVFAVAIVVGIGGYAAASMRGPGQSATVADLG